MRPITFDEMKTIRKLIKEYNHLISYGIYKGQYKIVRKLKPLLKRLKLSTDEQLRSITENEENRRKGKTPVLYDDRTKVIGKYDTKEIRKIMRKEKDNEFRK